MVRQRGFEPPRACAHQPLKLACLPFHHCRVENVFQRGQHYNRPTLKSLLAEERVGVESDQCDDQGIDDLCFDHRQSDKHCRHQLAAETGVACCTCDRGGSGMSHTDSTAECGETETDTGSDDGVGLDHALTVFTGESEGTECQEKCKKLFHRNSLYRKIRFWVPSTVFSDPFGLRKHIDDVPTVT